MSIAPTNASGVSTLNNLRTCDKFSKEFVIDRPIVTMFDLINYTTTDTLVGLIPGTGHPVFTQLNSSGIGGLLLNADDEGYSWLWPIPIDIDLAQEINFRILYGDATAVDAAKTNAWTFNYTLLDNGATAIAAAGTGLTKTSTTAAAGANYFYASAWATMAASTLTAEPGDDVLLMNVKVDITNTTPTLMAGQARYYRKYIG